jgi:phytoene dehydrogenase-like protein
MQKNKQSYDIIVAGAGMGGLTAAALLARSGYSVLVLEKAHVAGGCSSSFKRKKRVFESGATTLIGFDKNQPLKKLEDLLDIDIPKIPLDPSMVVHLNGKKITRWRDRNRWVDEAIHHFGESSRQEQFWKLAFIISDMVWKVSGHNHFFPPEDVSDWLSLAKNDPRNVWVLPYALKSVKSTASQIGISNPDFYRFLDEQLLISAQANSAETPFLFGAPAITYTNCTNYAVPGGLIEMVRTLEHSLGSNGGVIRTKEGVRSIVKKEGGYSVLSTKNELYSADVVISNIPVWNMAEVMAVKFQSISEKKRLKYQKAWGAFTMGIVTDDVYPDTMPLHHQIHIQ